MTADQEYHHSRIPMQPSEEKYEIQADSIFLSQLFLFTAPGVTWWQSFPHSNWGKRILDFLRLRPEEIPKFLLLWKAESPTAIHKIFLYVFCIYLPQILWSLMLKMTGGTPEVRYVPYWHLTFDFYNWHLKYGIWYLTFNQWTNGPW